jgi:Tol biopolymer transport system component
MTPELDSELKALLSDDPELLQVAEHLVRARPEPRLDPRFQAVLKARLVTEGRTILVPKRARLGLRRGWVAWASGGLGVAAATAAVAVLALNQVHSTTNFVAVSSPLAGQTHVDPGQAITVSFSQPMDQSTVVSALHIEPATAFTTSWSGNTLTITPDHHLAPNIPYVVTIDHNTAKSSNGSALQADVSVAFGTAPTPSPSAPPGTSVPALSPTQIGPADGDVVGFAPNGSILANGTPSTLATPTAPQPSPSSSTSPFASGGSGDGLYLYPSSGGSVRIAPHAQAASASPDGKHIAVVLQNSGGSTVEVVRSDGTHATELVTSSAPVVAVGWQSDGTIVYATAQTVSSVDFGKNVSTLGNAPGGDQIIGLSPNGAYAALQTVPAATAEGSASAPQTGVALLQLSGGNVQTLSANAQSVVFSSDSGWVAWVDNSGSSPQLVVSPTSGGSPSTVPLTGVGVDANGPLALNHDGSLLAFVSSGSSAALDVVSTSTGALVASGDGNVAALAFDDNDGHLAFTTRGGSSTLEVDTVPSASTATPVSDVPAGALQTLTNFINAQVTGDQGTLNSLSQDVNTQATPPGITRAYVVDTTVNLDGSVSATAELVVDPSSQHTSVTEASEALTLNATGPSGNYVVTKLTIGSLTTAATGPHVIGLSTSRTSTLFVLTFDSDLQPGSVQQAISLVDSKGVTLPISVHYDPNTRTATVSVLGPSPAHATLTVSTSLVDVENQHLATAFTHNVSG